MNEKGMMWIENQREVLDVQMGLSIEQSGRALAEHLTNCCCINAQRALVKLDRKVNLPYIVAIKLMVLAVATCISPSVVF